MPSSYHWCMYLLSTVDVHKYINILSSREWVAVLTYGKWWHNKKVSLHSLP